MSERFEVCKYSGGRKEEKQNRDIKKKKEREKKHSVLEKLYLKLYLKLPRKKCADAPLNVDLDKGRKEKSNFGGVNG